MFINFLNNIIRHSSYQFSSQYLLNKSKQKLILPFYHTVSNNELIHIKHLYRVKNTKEFIKDLDFLLSLFEPINIDTLFDISNGRYTIKKPVFLLSFDDGLKEIYENIAPILLSKGIPAAFFINSDFIDNKNLFFRYKASLIINEITNSLKKKSLASEEYSKHLSPINPSNLSAEILKIKYNNQYILDKIADSISLSFHEYLQTEQPYLNSNQINELLLKGFNIGAHSKDHPEYQYINLLDQIEQTKSSVAFLKDNFKIKKKLFSFPFTDHNVSKTFFEMIKNDIDLSFGCAGQKLDCIINHYQRIPFEQLDRSAKQIFNDEILRFMIKGLIGKQRILRS